MYTRTFSIDMSSYRRGSGRAEGLCKRGVNRPHVITSLFDDRHSTLPFLLVQVLRSIPYVELGQLLKTVNRNLGRITSCDGHQIGLTSTRPDPGPNLYLSPQMSGYAAASGGH